MTNFVTLRKSFLLGLLMAASSLCSMADEGHDHGDAPTVAAVPAKPRFTATSEAFELVGVVNGKAITLYLDHTADNRPVKDAALEMELGDTKLAVLPIGEGEFEVALAAALQPGEFSVAATVVAGSVTDLLAGDLVIQTDTHADSHGGAAYGAAWKKYGAWAAGGLLVLALLAFAMRRMGAQRIQSLGGAA